MSNEHKPCCSSHGIDMTCERYRRTHFVEVRPCCSADARLLEEEAKPENIKKLEREAGARKVRYLLGLKYLCCNSLVSEGHEVQCEHYPMEVS